MSSMTAPPLTHASAVGEPAADQAYGAFTARNRGLVSDADQAALRRASFLVAGCGSIGGAVVEPLIRLGAERLILAEPDVYELHNLNRQQASRGDVGRNKAVVLAEWAVSVNPDAEVRVETAGVTADNVAALVAGTSLVFDGVDVTSREALACKYLLHLEAKRAGVPVVCGYDIAGVQLVLVYDYRGNIAVLGGRVSDANIADLDPLQFLARVVPLRALPVEIFPILRRQLNEPGTAFPQLVYSARMFGVVASRLALDLLARRPVRRRILIDVNDLTRPWAAKWRTRLDRMVGLARMVPTVLAQRR